MEFFYQAERLGLFVSLTLFFANYLSFSLGKGGELVDRGDNTYGGKYVINPSGGLISKGHPLGATGTYLSFLDPVYTGWIGPRTIPNWYLLAFCLHENAGDRSAIRTYFCSLCRALEF